MSFSQLFPEKRPLLLVGVRELKAFLIQQLWGQRVKTDHEAPSVICDGQTWGVGERQR